MKKIITSILISGVLFFESISAFAAWTYQKPYDDITDVDMSHIEETMPIPFSEDNLIKILVGEADFNQAAFSDTLALYTGQNYWDSDKGVIAINKTQNTSSESFVLKYTPSEALAAGDYYLFSCKIKTEGVENASPKNILEAWGNKWLKASNTCNDKASITGNDDWYTMSQILKIPENTTSLRLQAYLDKLLTGTVYFDDFKLYKLYIDPMESVLVSPNYKGLVYGDGVGDIEVDIKIEERAGFYNLENMNLSVNLVDKDGKLIYSSKQTKLNQIMNFVFSSKALEEGDYYLQSILKDNTNGEIISKKEHTIRKRTASYRPENYVDENGHLVINGKKTFFKRMYNWGENYFTDAANFAVEANLDTIRLGGTWWANGSKPKDHIDAINILKENGITADIALSAFWVSNLRGNAARVFIDTQTDIPKLFYSISKDYKNSDTHAGYYIFDEPNPVTEGEEIRWNNEIFAQVDIDHPTYGVADKDYDLYGIYTKMADVLGVDPYPVTGNQDTDDIAKVGRSVKEIKKNFPNRPVYIVLQGFRYASRGDLRGPTEAELHNMAWQAICEGADGVDWYAYPEMNTDTVETLDEWKNKLLSVYNEIDRYKEVIVSDEAVPLYNVVGGGEWLNITLKRMNGKTYLFAVNNTYTSHAATINVDGAGSYSLHFEPLEVKKIEITQDSYLSPQAELKAIGFSNGTEVFAVGEGDENVLYVNEDSGVINYCARISDGAKLFIDGKERNMSGKITVRCIDSLTIKVVAEDGKTQTEKTYKVIKK